MNKQELFIGKLLRQTQDGNVVWHNNDYPIRNNSEERVNGKAYVSSFDDEIIRIYPYESKHYSDEDVYAWLDYIRLELIDDKGFTKWEFQNSALLPDLYRGVQYKTEKVDVFIDKFIRDNDSK